MSEIERAFRAGYCNRGGPVSMAALDAAWRQYQQTMIEPEARPEPSLGEECPLCGLLVSTVEARGHCGFKVVVDCPMELPA